MMNNVAECPKCHREAFSWDARAQAWMCLYHDCLHCESPDEYFNRDLKEQALKEPSREWLERMADAEDKCGCVSVGGLCLEVEAVSQHRRRMDECGIPEKDQAALAMFVEGMMEECHPFNQVIDGNPEYQKFAEEVLERRGRKITLLKEALRRLDKSAD